MPSASSCFLHVFGFRKIAQEKVPEKIEKIAKKYFATKEVRSQKASPGGPPVGWGDPTTRPVVDPRQGAAQAPRVASGTDLLPYLFFGRETSESATLFPELDPRRRHHQKP